MSLTGEGALPASSAVTAQGGTALRGDEFAALNDQLAQITAAGLPLEEGLRLVGADLRRGRLARVVQAISADLDRGVPLEDALAAQAGALPESYVSLVRAGAKSGKLSQILMGLGAHLALTRKLQAALWRAMAYPVVVLAAMLLVIVFIDLTVIPQFRGMKLPPLQSRAYMARVIPGVRESILPPYSLFVFALADGAPFVAAVLFLAMLLLWLACRIGRLRGVLADRVLLHVPLVGPALRDSKLAVWCDTLRLGIEAGLDLPAAIELAAAGGTPGMFDESRDVAESLRRAEHPALRGRWITQSVRHAIDAGARAGNVQAAAASLATFYRRRSEARADSIPTVLGPLLLAMIAVAVLMLILALMAPLVEMMRWITAM